MPFKNNGNGCWKCGREGVVHWSKCPESTCRAKHPKADEYVDRRPSRGRQDDNNRSSQDGNASGGGGDGQSNPRVTNSIRYASLLMTVHEFSVRLIVFVAQLLVLRY